MSSSSILTNGHAAKAVETPTTAAGPAYRLLVEQAVVPLCRWYLGAKRCADFLVAVVLLVPAIPIVALAALAIKLTSRGPMFYSQTRLGRDGEPFRLWKLRTMVHNAEALTGPVWSTTNDSRVTRVGRFLRATHLDELPQLLNVLSGAMSLVGPRPERPEFVTRLQWEIPSYSERLRVSPGVTGLAQLKLPPDSDIHSVRRKLIYDLYYVRNVNPWLDLRILIGTASYLLGTLAWFGWRIVALPSNASIEEAVIAWNADTCPTLKRPAEQ